MYKIVISLFVFCIILFFYIHIHFHFKTSSDLEVFEIEEANKEKFDQICDLRQPTIIQSLMFKQAKDHFLIKNLTSKFNDFELNVRNTNVSVETPNMNIYKLFSLEDTIHLIKKNPFVYSENNQKFIEETCLMKYLKQTEDFLKPSFLIKSKYDLLIGSQCKTPFKYEVSYRNYITPIESEIIVKLVPPKYSQFMEFKKDYEYFQFLSTNNLWEDEPMNKKIKSLTFTLYPGQVLFIPAYWWYSFHFVKPNLLVCNNYFTIMNSVSIMPDIIMYLFQNQNIKHKSACLIKKDVNTDTNTNTDDTYKDDTNTDETNTNTHDTCNDDLIKDIKA